MYCKQMRVQGYISLSRMLQRPGQELLGLLSSLEFDRLWRQIEDSYGVGLPAGWRARELPAADELCRMWDVTMGAVKPLAQPIESLYKVWTTDKSCEMPFAGQKGNLWSDWACHMEQLLVGAGFVIPRQFLHSPDHLVLELEFASVLAEQAPVESQLMFAEQHLDWLGDLCDTSREKNAPKLYQDLYDLCRKYVKADINGLATAH